jgi:cysteine desulfurase
MPVYLDHAASTPVDPRVLEAMRPWFSERPGNAASQHLYGRMAAAAVEQARCEVAAMLGTASERITFVSGATESCNLALKGLMRPRLRRGETVHIVSSATEHPAVLDPLRRLEREGAVVDLVPPTQSGRVSLEEVTRRLRDDTALVSLQWVNNELGTINDVEGVGHACRERGVLLHCDASQAPGKLPIDLSDLPVDALTISGHKMHGPKGCGVLVLQGRAQGRPVEPIVEGGGHEHGLRSGTLNVPAIVGLGRAAAIVASEGASECERITVLAAHLRSELQRARPDAVFNGDFDRQVPHILNLTIPSQHADPLIERLSGIACSSGSACGSARHEPSHVLRAIGLDDATIAATIRLSLGRETTREDIDTAIGILGSV